MHIIVRKKKPELLDNAAFTLCVTLGDQQEVGSVAEGTDAVKRPTHMIETGIGIFQLQKFLGHKHLTTTLVYVHLNEEKTVARSPLDVYADQFKNESPSDR